MTVLFNGQIYLFEFKVVELVSEGKALQLIREQRSVVGFEMVQEG